MERLEFTLPDFCRINWASERARETWNPIFVNISAMWRRMEINTVVLGQRRVGLICVVAAELETFKADMDKKGLAIEPLYALNAETYVSERNSSNLGQKHRICAIGLADNIAAAKVAFNNNHTDLLGRLLGYPACCIDFFDKTWNRDRFIDTTWPMAAASVLQKNEIKNTIAFKVEPENNMLLRWIGLRPVFHLPCCLKCEETRMVASQIRALAHEMGDGELMDSLYAILRWPIQWSALHGIAEIETPVMRISTRTDATPTTYCLQIEGDPTAVTEGVFGNRFPYALRAKYNLRQERTIQLVKKASMYDSVASSQFFIDNGFRTRLEMERAFEPIVNMILKIKPQTVRHIGCKNGALLHKVAQADESLRLYGIDSDPERINQAKALFRGKQAKFDTGKLSDSAFLRQMDETDICVIMIGRLLELPFADATTAIAELRNRSRTMVIYAFDDWTAKAPIAKLAERVGLQVTNVLAPSVAVIIPF